MTVTIKRIWFICVAFVFLTCSSLKAQITVAEVTSAPEETNVVLKQVDGVALSSKTGEPVRGALVSIPGVSSAFTDDEGRFSLQRCTDGDVIGFTAEGFAYREIVVGRQAYLRVELHDETFQSVYRQITTPFGLRNWTNNSASISTFSNKDNYKRAAVSTESLLQDEALGVRTVMRSGMAGAGANMYLRGTNTIYATSQPLVVIDGVPFENAMNVPSRISGNYLTPLTGIDPKDIRQVTVLKDAASIYGSKGANGVILIETARATEHATVIDFHAHTGMNQSPAFYPMMNAFQYRSYLTEMLSSQGLTAYQIQELPYINQEEPEVFWWGVEGNADYHRYKHDTDWQKEVFRNSMTQSYHLGIRGGDDVAMYALSVGYMNHEALLKGSDFSRYNTQFNSELNITRWLKMTGNMNFAYSFRNLANEGMSPFSPVMASLRKAPFQTPFLYNVNGQETLIRESADLFGVSNPLSLVSPPTALESKTYRFFGNMGADVTLGKYLHLNILFGVTFDKMRESIFLPSEGLVHELLPQSEVDRAMQAEVSRYMQYYFDSHLAYSRSFDRKHNITAFVGGRYQTNNMGGNWIHAYNSTSDDLRTVGNGILELASVAGIMGEWKWLSLYLNGEYNYRNKYFLSYNMAVDGSSRFGKEADGLKIGGNVFGVFPSLTAAWLVTSENFGFMPQQIDLLKLRVGYSVAGNDGIGNYNSRTLYASQAMLGFSGLLRENFANPKLKWETSQKINLGVDVAAFNERLIIALDVFNNVTKDMIIWKESGDYAGITAYLENDGVMKNTGFEAGVQGRIINGELKWDLALNIGKYKNEITELSQDAITEVAGAKILTRKGNPVGLFYGYRTDGVYTTADEAAAAGMYISRRGENLNFTAGDVKFVKQTAGGLLDESDLTVIGDPNPDWYGSIINKFYWKRFALNAVFTYSVGNDVYNALRANLESMKGYDNQTINVANRWMKEGHKTNTPKATWGDPMENSRFSDRWIEDGSYLRLKSLTLSYDIPLKIRFIRGLQVYATGLNLITFTKYLGYDPEFSAMQSPLYYGIDLGALPQPRSFMVGVKLEL